MIFKSKEDSSIDEVVAQSDEVNESENDSKSKSQPSLVLKIACLVLSISAIVLVIFNAITLFQNRDDGPGKYLNLTGKSERETQDILKEYGNLDTNDKNLYKIEDYSFVGSKLFLSENKITPLDLANKNLFQSPERRGEFCVYNLSSNYTLAEKTDINNNQFYIDFNSLDKGDYFIYPNYKIPSSASKSDYYFYSLSSNKENNNPIKIVTYTLPNSNGERYKITFKSNYRSPYTMISLTDSGSAKPTDYFDIVLFYQQYDFNKFQTDSVKKQDSEYIYDYYKNSEDSSLKLEDDLLNKLNEYKEYIEDNYHMSVKVATSLKDATLTNANTSICLSKDSSLDFSKAYTSLYLNHKDLTSRDYFNIQTLTDTSLLGYDSIPEIRENIGYLSKSGESTYNVLANNINPTKTKVGKESYLIYDDKQSIKGLIDSLSKRAN